MKRLLLVVAASVILSGCSTPNQPQTQPEVISTPAVAEPSSLPMSPGVQNLIIKENNFGIDEIYVTEGEALILAVYNQIDEPVNVVISELGVRTPEIAPGQMLEISVPTDQVGEYEMYSSLGTQQEEGFSALLTVEEIEE